MSISEILAKSLKRLDSMPVDEFERMCINAGFNPIRKEDPVVNVGTIGHIDWGRYLDNFDLKVDYSGIDTVIKNYWAFVEDEMKSAIIHIYPDIDLTSEEDLCKIESEFRRIDTPESIHFCYGDKELVVISKNTTQATRYYGDNL